MTLLVRVAQANTEELFDFYRRQQIDTEFCINFGNHFTEPIKRSASGIKWLLTR
ncbi:MAG: hypothetical protein NC124_11215 [Clostridium sp.]|nr:hypothetical protein [Clostridium sp.]